MSQPAAVSRLYRPVVGAVDLLLRVAAGRRYRALDRIPATGAAILVCNHLSVADPLVLGTAIHRAGRDAAFLGKAEVFGHPLLGPLLRRMGHIPVHRGTADAARALEPALAALRAGRLVALYPEGRITTDPGYRPLPRARTGAVRLALAAGCPVLPVAQWGAHRLVTREHGSSWTRRPRPFGWLRSGRVPRRPQVELLVGEPISATELAAAAGPEQDLHAATALLMSRVNLLLDVLVEAGGGGRDPAEDGVAADDRERGVSERRPTVRTAA